MSQRKFHHEEIYRGKDLLKNLEKKITICGAGALGSNLVDNLTRQGMSNIKVIDMDRVDVHNINTQIWTDGDIGSLKVDALRNKIFRSVGIEIEVFSNELTESNVKKLLKGSELVVDVFDNNNSRNIVQKECRLRKFPCLHVGLYEDYAEVIWDDKYDVPNDSIIGDVCDYPLARNIVMLAVVVASEEIINFCIKPRGYSWTITLKDLQVRRK